MKKLAVYYEENIIDENGKIYDNVLQEWKESEKEIVLCSYKTISYIVGMLSALNVRNVYIVAEGGALVQYGIVTSPKKYYLFSCEEEKGQINEIKAKLQKFVSDIWFQDNMIGITGFVSSEDDKQKLFEFYRQYKNKYRLVNFCLVGKQIRVMPLAISFERALKYIERDM